MGRTAVLGILAGIVLAWSWLRLERGEITWSLIFVIALLGVAPALPSRPRLRAALVALAALAGLEHVYGTLRPRVIRDEIVDGFYRYYDIALPFNPDGQAKMHALVVLAILGFTLAVSLAVAARRAVLAAVLLVAGAVWPATLLTSSNTVGRGAVVLAAALAILAGVAATARAQQAAIAGAVVIAAAVGMAGIPAVAKGGFLGWETWEPARADLPVSVAYVWETNYQALEWPDKKTVVFTVDAPPTSRYWRATTLDVANGGHWLHGEDFVQLDPVVVGLLPARAQRPENQLEARFTIRALEDTRLLGASVPVRYDAGDLDGVYYDSNGNATVPTGVPRGTEYTTWSFAARPTPAQLAASRPVYPATLASYRIADARSYATPPLPVFGTPNRDALMDELFAENPSLRPYWPLFNQARTVARNAPSPYAAVIALEAWFRDTSRFTYDQSPPTGSIDGAPALTQFVVNTRRGHCQHFAGAMALMLRYLGIPSRVAAGFLSGSYDQESRRWTVTDHDAHTWVEVWFRGYGWLPFDPTPGRGTLDGAYTTASLSFNPAALAAALVAAGGSAELGEQFANTGGPERGASRDLPGDVGGGAGGGTDDDPSLLRLLALVAAALVAGIALLKLGVRRLRYATRDPRRVAAACRRELSDFLADQRVAVPESATAAELGEILHAETGVDADAFVVALDAARYGPPDEAPAAARRARRELRRLERTFRRQLSTWDRARGLVSLRSLGFSS